MSEQFALSRWDDPEHWQQETVFKGDLANLPDYASYEGKYSDSPASMAVVFSEQPILRACNLVDLPGFRGDPTEADEDAKRAQAALPIADVLLYLSPATNFMNGQDMVLLARIIASLRMFDAEVKECPPYGNLYVIATHSHPAIERDDIDKRIIGKSTRRLASFLKETVHRDSPMSEQDLASTLRSCFFPFWAETGDFRAALFESLERCLGLYAPKVKLRRAEERLARFKADSSAFLTSQVSSLRAIIENIERARQEYEDLQGKKRAEEAAAAAARARVHERISNYKREHSEGVEKFYLATVTPAAVESLIRDKFGADKAEAQKFAAALVIEMVQFDSDTRAKACASKLAPDVEKYLRRFERLSSETLELGGIAIPFDSKGAFLGGVVGAGTLGALAIWASTLGNLGGYIIVAKAASILAAAGIGFAGGSAGLTALVATIGGPVTIAIAVVALAALGVWALFGSSWQTRLAAKICDELNKNRALDRLLGSISAYWGATARAFEAGADAVQAEFQRQIDAVLAILRSPGNQPLEELTRNLQYYVALKNALERVP